MAIEEIDMNWNIDLDIYCIALEGNEYHNRYAFLDILMRSILIRWVEKSYICRLNKGVFSIDTFHKF